MNASDLGIYADQQGFEFDMDGLRYIFWVNFSYCLMSHDFQIKL